MPLPPGSTLSGSALHAATRLSSSHSFCRPVYSRTRRTQRKCASAVAVNVGTPALRAAAVSARADWRSVGVAGFGWALLGSLFYSLCGMVIDAAIERVFSKNA